MSGDYVPTPDWWGEDGEWLVIDGWHDQDEAALVMLKAYADVHYWAEAAELLDDGWAAFRSSVQRIYATDHPSGEWTSFHTLGSDDARPVMVLGVEGYRIDQPHPSWPDWVIQRDAEAVQSGSPASQEADCG